MNYVGMQVWLVDDSLFTVPTEHVNEAALQAYETEKEWKEAYYQRAEQLRIEDKKDGGDRFRRYYDYYRGRHVPKAELNRIRLMLQKEMLEVER